MQLLESIDALLITNPTNVRYLTGFVGSAENEREAYVLITKEQTLLFTNALYLEQAKATNTTVVEISRENPFEKKLAWVLKRSHPAKRGETLKRLRLGFEENDLTVAEYHKIMLEHKNVRLIPTKGRVEKLRMIKREGEIENIRQAARLTDQCFDFILDKFKPGVTEGEIAWEIESFIRNRGAGVSFSPIVAFGKNTSQPHYQSSAVSLQSSDIVLMDFGARINGYCSDMTRVVFVGKPNAEWTKAYKTVLSAQRAALEYLQRSHPASQGETFQERSGSVVDRIARSIIKKPYPHSLGHGVGLDIHEAPRLTIKKNVALKPGMVVTIEPAIYKEGSYGIRIEDLIVLKNNNIELLSKSSSNLTVL